RRIGAGDAARRASARRLRIAQAIAEAVHRLDGLAVRAEALAQPADVRIDRARVRLGQDAPDLLEEIGAREDAAGMLDEDRKELVLERAQRELFALDEDAMARGIDLEPAPREALAFVASAARETSLVGATREPL